MESIITSFVTPMIRHGLTAIAGMLVSYGMLAPAQSNNFVVIGLGLASGVIGLGWSFYKNKK